MRVLGLQSGNRVMAWPLEDIAMLREEALGRLEAVRFDGTVAWRPGPPEAAPPLVEAAPGVWVNPRHVRREGSDLVVPGGWRVPSEAPLPVLSEEPEPPGLPVPARDVLYLEPGRWVTVRGSFPGPRTARRLPWLARAGPAWINLARLDGLWLQDGRWRLALRAGPELPIGPRAARSICTRLGLPPGDPRRGDGPHPAMFRLGLRDWPDELLQQPAEALAPLAADPDSLIANLVWQAKRRGLVYSRDVQGLWYSLVRPVLERCGLMEDDAGDPDDATLAWLLDLVDREPGWEADNGWRRRFEILLARMVGDMCLLTYADLGLDDPRPDMRAIGDRHPEILVCAEKHSLREAAFLLHRLFGVSVIVLGGSPSLQSAEALAAALASRLQGRPVRLVTLVDWDVGGWGIWQGLAGQLRRYGLEVELVGHLVRPTRFTPREIELFAFPIHPDGPQARGRARRWLEETGGIDGHLAGIHADHLRPTERVVQAMVEETGLHPSALG